MGPMPLNFIVSPGRETLADLVKKVERGLLVTHIHYTGLIDAATLLVTGMTRDGTFLIEQGKIRHPVQNLRFSQSLLDALASVRAVSSETSGQSHPFIRGYISAPGMVIDNFHFSSATLF